MEATTIRPLATHGVTQQTLSPQQVVFSKQFAELPVKKADELICSQAPAVHMVDKESLAVCVSLLIGKYLSFIGCSNQMNQETTYETACIMIETHPHIPVDAIKTFFHECKRGLFGFHYNKMDGTKILMWYDEFVNNFYKKLDDAQYELHMQSKNGLTKKLTIEEEECVSFEELYESFNGKSIKQTELEDKIKDIRLKIIEQNKNLYDLIGTEEAEKVIEQAIVDELKAQNILTF